MPTTDVTAVQSLESRISRYGPIAYCILLFIAAIVSRFALLSNDSFPLEWQAAHLSLHNPQSFFDGFFPIGYPLLLRAAEMFVNPYTTLEIIQILFSILYFKTAWACARSFLDTPAAAISLVIILFFPWLILSIFSIVPDFFAALLALLAMYEITKERPRRDWLVGIWLGLSILFREHTILLVLAITIALIIFEAGKGLQRAGKIWAATLPFIAVQGCIQVWAGHGFFENDQAFNVWKLMHGVDWANPPIPFHSGLTHIIVSEPGLFFRTYLSLFAGSLYLIILLVLVIVFGARKRRTLQRLTVLSVAALLYLLASLPGGSARASLLVIPVIVVGVVRVLQDFTPWLFRRQKVIYGFAAIAASVAFIFIFLGAGHSAARISQYNLLQQTLDLRSANDARSVYTDDFALYFPALGSATPRTTGGWPELGLPGYLLENPHIPDTTAHAFFSALKAHAIQYAVIRNPPLDARALQWAQTDTLHFTPVPFKSSFYVYRVK